ncbi:hypothetical protein [Gorillibacterium sp. sgz5001074]|uniref:hypothetical protein n=1 Tax=Gorillibacterium sp. sgz5001074 TaxID=3446695 RepID=UPI003F67A3A8
MIPCLNKESLKLLVGTADERYSYSSEYFNETHFPQVMHKYQGNNLIAEVTELELLDDLSNVDTAGNRVYLVFGSTGSGKSELLCWIRDQWIKRVQDRPVVRISRTELNPQVLIKKCYETFNIPIRTEIDENRWELLQKKPVTLINQMVWSTLSDILDSDEEIIPAALLLRHHIERNILEFTKQVENGKITTPLEVLYPAQFEELLANTTITLNLDYEGVRQALSRKLDQYLFEGWDMGSLFRHLSKELVKRNIRPLLLIDDLVQSVNIYANDLLDQLITLEEGNWDVVIGLTPGSIQDSKRGVEITKRIQTLDTIDDRVKKLWLSDETGKVFYNLGREQSVPYMRKYLSQLKASQGFDCSMACAHFTDCKSQIITNNVSVDENEIVLHPFNESMIRRIYDAIPIGKGKLRYIILYSKEIVRFFQKGDRKKISRIIPYIAREAFAEHPDVFLKTIAEWMAPEEDDSVVLPRSLLKNFGYQLPDQTVRLHSLGGTFATEIDYKTIDKQPQTLSIDHLVIRDWVEGKKTNIELLEPVRLGVASLLHDVTKATNMLRPFTPRSSSVIQRKEVVKGARYPISFQANSSLYGHITVRRSLAALEVSNLHHAKPSERARFFNRISNDWDTASWVYQSDLLHHEWESKLEEVLGISLNEFAYNLKCWVEEWVLLSKSDWANIKDSPFSKELRDITEQLFQDWYLLRDNMIDPIKPKYFDFEQWLNNITPSKSLEQYQIGTQIPLSLFLLKLKDEFNEYKSEFSVQLREKLLETIGLTRYLHSLEDPTKKQYAITLDLLREKHTLDFIDYKTFHTVNQKMVQSGVYEDFKFVQKREKVLLEWSNRVNSFRGQLCKLMSDIEDSSEWKAIEDSSLITEMSEDQVVQLSEDMIRLIQTLTMTPRGVVREILISKVITPTTIGVQKQWRKVRWIVEQLLSYKFPDSNYIHDLQAWDGIDFHKVMVELVQINKRATEISNIVSRMCEDMGWYDIEDLQGAITRINNSTDLRPAIRRQLIQLLENGYSNLPLVQWKNLIEEMKGRFPKVFEVVDIKLVAGKDL